MPPKAWFGIVKVIGAVRGCWWGRLDLPLLVRKRAGIPSADLQRRLMAHTTHQTTVCHWEGVSFSFTVTSRTNVLVNTRPPSLRSCKMQETFLTRQGFLSFPGDLFQGTCTGKPFWSPNETRGGLLFAGHAAERRVPHLRQRAVPADAGARRSGRLATGDSGREIGRCGRFAKSEPGWLIFPIQKGGFVCCDMSHGT